MKTIQNRKMILTALFIAIGLLLPSFFHLIAAGNVLLPMHIPIFLCGMICGRQFGMLAGMILPLLSSVLTGMPPIFPTAFTMVFELAVYGFLSGHFYAVFSRFNYSKLSLYASLILAMLAGRIVSGVINTILFGLGQTTYGWQAFISASFIVSLPGIILQLALIPPLVLTLSKFLALEKPCLERHI